MLRHTQLLLLWTYLFRLIIDYPHSVTEHSVIKYYACGYWYSIINIIVTFYFMMRQPTGQHHSPTVTVIHIYTAIRLRGHNWSGLWNMVSIHVFIFVYVYSTFLSFTLNLQDITSTEQDKLTILILTASSVEASYSNMSLRLPMISLYDRSHFSPLCPALLLNCIGD